MGALGHRFEVEKMIEGLEGWLDRVTFSTLGRRATVSATFDLATALIARGVPGDFVECGVYAGGECAVMAKAIMTSGQTGRRVHLFDSFQGIPRPGPEDLEFVEANVQAGGASCPMADVKKNMRDWGVREDLLVYHPGWFEDTVPGCDVDKIALLRLDGDLYTSTKVCLDHLFPKVSIGGWVIVDDYPLSGCRKALHECVMPQPIYFNKVD